MKRPPVRPERETEEQSEDHESEEIEEREEDSKSPSTRSFHTDRYKFRIFSRLQSKLGANFAVDQDSPTYLFQFFCCK
jgi:hypothetical protein